MVEGIIIPADDTVPLTAAALDSLDDYQRAVSGWIEAVDVPDLGVTMYVNEEGLIRDLPYLPLVIMVGPGQAGDSPMFPVLMNHLRVGRRGPGRPRSRPDRVRGDKAYSSRAIRHHLRSRGIVAVIPEPADQQRHRRRRGARGGRPVAHDPDDYKGRNVVERGFNETKQWRGLATRYDKLAITYRGGVVLRAITLWLKAGAVPIPRVPEHVR